MGTDPKAIAALEAESPPDWVAREFPSEQPAHAVTLTKGYWIDKDEVTNAAFAAFVDRAFTRPIAGRTLATFKKLAES